LKIILIILSLGGLPHLRS